MGILNKVKLWRATDGTFAITCFVKEGMKKGETEEAFILRSTEYLKRKHAVLNSMQEIDSTRDALKDAVRSNPNGGSHKLRARADGTLFLDHNAKTEEEIRSEKEGVVRGKLSGLGLTSDEVDFILKKKGD